ncbi:hypothetical protein M514_12309 [Trichuris suis]|uniref:G-protein coupled receptors family 1 profile domain-containing protein n=1 Tax=Trichuris suis TaxID=68888 RepID=A0A085LPD0_9BILA|nr:hypothetical protein M513_12309 [Trichuris suis]KFD61840.1 hypothetical protein M514_12309 [Trichuris suis]
MLGTVVIISHHSLQPENFNLTTPLRCLIFVPSVPLYTFGQPVMVLSTFLIAMDYFSIMCFVKARWKTTNKTANPLVALSFSVGLLNVAIVFITAIVPKRDPVSTSCLQQKVMLLIHLRFVYALQSMLGLFNLTLYLATMIFVATRKAKFDTIRLSQIRRKEAAMKQVTITIFFTFMAQTVPHFFAFVVSFKPSSYTLEEAVWIITTAFHSGYPVYRLLRYTRKRLVKRHQQCRRVGQSERRPVTELH